ncbi:MAG: hypothetical protein JWO11_3060 [Nocardioides sp.]|nr:hypothetical protein [Nocardioides sp.]
MSARVFVHIGLPKTGTSYLQSILWSHRDELAAAGMLLPGRERRDHLWASLVVRGDTRLRRRHTRAPSSWRVIQEEIAGWDGDALISHEFFCSATADQARAMVGALEPAEVHLVITAREPLSLFTSSWQEHLKNKGTATIENYAREVSADPRVVWNWRALDLSLVLERWGDVVPDDRIHILTMPEDTAPPDDLWLRFCSVLDVSPEVGSGAEPFLNSSMGVVEAETLRRVNLELTGFDRAYDRGVWIRAFLADERLVPRGGDRFWPSEKRIEDCRRRGAAAVSLISRRDFDVVGDPESLRVPEELPHRRRPDSVTDAEVADVAVALVARLVDDVREASARGPKDASASSLGQRIRRRLRG